MAYLANGKQGFKFNNYNQESTKTTRSVPKTINYPANDASITSYNFNLSIVQQFIVSKTKEKLSYGANDKFGFDVNSSFSLSLKYITFLCKKKIINQRSSYQFIRHMISR